LIDCTVLGQKIASLMSGKLIAETRQQKTSSGWWKWCMLRLPPTCLLLCSLVAPFVCVNKPKQLGSTEGYCVVLLPTLLGTEWLSDERGI